MNIVDTFIESVVSKLDYKKIKLGRQRIVTEAHGRIYTRSYGMRGTKDGKNTIHVESITPNPVYGQEDTCLVMYRHWSTKRQRWYWKVEMYWEIAIRNKWKYKL
jgi:hypothetical protein